MKARWGVMSAVIAIGGLAAPAPSRATEAQLPNLVPLPASDLRMGLDDEERVTALRFTSTIANRGDWPLEVSAQRDLNRVLDSGDLTKKSFQCVEWTAPYLCARVEPAGQLEWSDSHGHYHFQDFARYELRVAAGGEVDWSDAGVVATGEKVGFCFADTAREESDGHPEYAVGNPLYLTLSCANGDRQGISPNWTDIYSYRFVSQQIVLPGGIPDGEYALVNRINVGSVLREETLADNASVRLFRVSGGAITTL